MSRAYKRSEVSETVGDRSQSNGRGGLIKSFSELVMQRSGFAGARSRSDSRDSASAAKSSALHQMAAGSGFSQNDYLRDRQEQLKIQREFHRQLKD